MEATLTDPDGIPTGANITGQWARSADGVTYTDIPDTSMSAYTPQPADVGYYLWVTAQYTDNHGGGKSAMSTATGQVAAGNRPPAFRLTRTVAENTPSGRAIGGPVTAADPDSSALTYSLGGVDAASFAIDSSSGQLRTAAALDYETKNTHTVMVTAADDQGASASVYVVIRVTDVAE